MRYMWGKFGLGAFASHAYGRDSQIIGGCASGKSTQSRLLTNRFGVVHVDIRDILLQKVRHRLPSLRTLGAGATL